jgi:hypothetical protein
MGMPTADYIPNGDMMANGLPHTYANGHFVKIVEIQISRGRD